MAFGHFKEARRGENNDCDPRLSHIDHTVAKGANVDNGEHSTPVQTPIESRQAKRNSTLHLHDAADDPTSELNKFLGTAKSLHTSRAMFYSLALEPFQDRKERICQLAEACALFGALFLSGIYFVWECGDKSRVREQNAAQSFEILCAIGFIATSKSSACNVCRVLVVSFDIVLSNRS